MKKIALLLLIFLVFAGCSEKKEKVRVLEIASMWNIDEPQGQWLRLMADEFETENGVTVNIDFSGREVLTKVRSRLAIGEVPDMVEQDFGSLYGAFLAGDRESLQPINDVFESESLDGDGLIDDLYDKSIRLPYMLAGKQYLFPYYYVTHGFFYNKRFFRENNLSIPETWEELMALGRKLKPMNVALLALDGGVNFYNLYYFTTIAERVLGPGMLDAAVRDKTGNAWTDPGWMKVAEMTSRLSSAGDGFFQPNYQASSWPAAQKDWANTNSVALIYVGSWIAVETKGYASDGFEYGFFPFPSIEGGAGSSRDMPGTFFGMAVMAKAKNPDLAKKFLMLISTRERSNTYVAISDTMSARRGTVFPEILNDIKPYLENVEQSYVLNDGIEANHGQWMETVMYPLDNALIFGEISAEEFIRSIAEESKKFYSNQQ